MTLLSRLTLSFGVTRGAIRGSLTDAIQPLLVLATGCSLAWVHLVSCTACRVLSTITATVKRGERKIIRARSLHLIERRAP
jgi:hypothetical protein